MSSSKQSLAQVASEQFPSTQQDVNEFVGNNIGLVIDILWVTALAGMIASLSFAEWQRSVADVARAAEASAGKAPALVSFLGCTALFFATLFVGGWYGSIPMSWWALLLLAILSALSIIQTIIAMRRWMRAFSRRAATPAI